MGKSKKRRHRTGSPPGAVIKAVQEGRIRQDYTTQTQMDMTRTNVLVSGKNPPAKVLRRMLQSIRNLDDDTILRRQTVLLRSYQDALLAVGYGMSRAELQAKNVIDVRPLASPTQSSWDIPTMPMLTDPDYQTTLQAMIQNGDGFYTSIPCFTEGILQLNEDRYIHWNIKTIDTRTQTMQIYLMDYLAQSGIWQTGVSGSLSCHMTGQGHMTFQTLIETPDYTRFSSIYQMLDYQHLPFWSDIDIEIWEKLVLANARYAEQTLHARNTNNLMELAKIFFQRISLVNYYLSLHKPKAVRQKAGRSNTTVIAAATPQTERRITRTVSTIVITSPKPPRRPTEETVVRYKTAVWHARGGVRRMKSGKLVPFKESIRHRKCLQSDTSNTQPVPTTLQIKPGKQPETDP